jgi:hypothetical protein
MADWSPEESLLLVLRIFDLSKASHGLPDTQFFFL